MKKIPTLFLRDPSDMSRITRTIHRDCGWVLTGEGTATRKYDGTCVMFNGQSWWSRREVKAGKTSPPLFVPTETDSMTGKTVGWEPIEQSSFAKWHAQALTDGVWTVGTYELIGPKINGNPEGVDTHDLICHAHAERYPAMNMPKGYDELARVFETLPWEGIVWHHPDGRMAKLKIRDFGRTSRGRRR